MQQKSAVNTDTDKERDSGWSQNKLQAPVRTRAPDKEGEERIVIDGADEVCF